MASRHPVAYPTASPDAIESFREHGYLVVEAAAEPRDLEELVRLELPAGSVVFLGSLLVHRSSPNRSESDRRALLYSYQPAGHRHAREYIRIDPERGIEIGPPGGAAEPGA